MAGHDRAQGHGILMAWLIFAGMILLAGAGLGLAVVVNNRSAQPETPTDIARAENHPANSLRIRDGGLPDTKTTPPAVRRPASADPAPARAPAPSADRAVKLPQRDTPPPLPKPAERTPPAARKEKASQAERPRAPEANEPPQPVEKPRAPKSTRQESPQVSWLPADTQKRVDRTIDRGVEFLRRQQHFDGSWGHLIAKVSQRFTPGVTALAALTLLECGVSGEDPQVQLAAKYLRGRMPDIATSYSIAMTILFFDRLGEASDVPRIRTLAMRLIAGQKPSGGWDYFCPTLSEDEELGLLAMLYKDRPTSPRDLFGTERAEPPTPDLAEARQSPRLEGELYRPRPSPVPPLDLFIAQGPAVPQEPSKRAVPDKSPDRERPSAEKPSSPPAQSTPAPDSSLPGDPRRLSERARTAAANLPESLLQTPALHSGKLLRAYPDLVEPRTDNSNTQLAILGLLTAEVHDVPIERTMALIDWRFRNSITEKLGWNYRPNWPTTPAMTAAALMGLALKHGLLLPNPRDRGRHITVRDPLIQRAFLTLDHLLDRYIEGFYTRRTKLEKLDLYCLWTVERVAVLYNLRRVGAIEWYPEGVKLLLPLQLEDGSWGPGGTTCLDEPTVSTSFALLFLKRSNPARQLTERLSASVGE
jgi:hypothetical protein